MKLRVFYFSLFLYFLIVSFFIFARIYFEKWFFPPLSKTNNEVMILINKGDTLDRILKDLKSQGIINHKEIFKLFLVVNKLDKKIIPGTYILNKNMTYKEIAKALTSGSQFKEVWITIPEGYELQDIDKVLFEKKLISKRKEFIKFLNNLSPKEYFLDNFKELYMLLKDKNISSFEGFLFPDTYKFKENESKEKILKKFVFNFIKRLKERDIFEKINQKNLDFYQVLTIASILEKEVKTFKEKRLVADILWRRLSSGMKLEVDSTLNYILEKDKRLPALTYDKLEIDSPYNTYKYKGLPPSPISNPGINSIIAAVFPLKNNYWYYVSDVTSGITYFSENYKDHLKKKNLLNSKK